MRIASPRGFARLSEGEKYFAIEPDKKMNHERELLRNKHDLISTHRAVLSGTTYAMHQINSVRTHAEPPNRRPALIAIGTGIFVALLGVLVDRPSLWAVGGAATALGVWLWVKGKTTHFLVLSTSSGEVRSLHSHDRAEVQRYADAVSEAIVQRNA